MWTAPYQIDEQFWSFDSSDCAYPKNHAAGNCRLSPVTVATGNDRRLASVVPGNCLTLPLALHHNARNVAQAPAEQHPIAAVANLRQIGVEIPVTGGCVNTEPTPQSGERCDEARTGTRGTLIIDVRVGAAHRCPEAGQARMQKADHRQARLG